LKNKIEGERSITDEDIIKVRDIVVVVVVVVVVVAVDYDFVSVVCCCQVKLIIGKKPTFPPYMPYGRDNQVRNGARVIPIFEWTRR